MVTKINRRFFHNNYNCLRVVLSLERVEILGRNKAGLASGVWVLLLFLAVFGVVLKVPLVKSNSGTIYIRPDGSIEPSDAPISTLDNITYTFTNHVNDPIVVERSNIIIDGAGYALQGNGSGKGMNLSGRTNVTVRNTQIQDFEYGIYLYSSDHNSISGNSIVNDSYGIMLGYILDGDSCYNSISGNTITANNEDGIVLCHESSNNTIYHNNFADNTKQVNSPHFENIWDNGIEGNYWSNFNGTDENYDGIGDSWYEIDENNTDHYPLMGMFYSYDVFWIDLGFTVTLVSNSTVSNFAVGVWIEHPENRIISFDVTGEIGYGFCRLCIPKDLMAPPYTVIIDNGETSVLHYNKAVFDNSTHGWIYFGYQQSEHQLIIIPEFPSFLIPPLFMIATLLAVIVYKKREV